MLLNLLFQNANAQDFNPETVSLPNNPTAQDFSFLKEQLQDVQVVMLGERTHSDGNVFEVKTEIIKYLHKELGFSTIAFESGTYDVWKAQKEIGSGESPRAAFEKSLFPVWARAKEFQGFVSFFEMNKKRLKVFGFDSQITGQYGEKELVRDLYEYCHQNQLPLKLNREDLELVLESINNSGVFDQEDIPYEKYKSSLSNLLVSMEKKPRNENQFYWKQIIKNLLSVGEDSHSGKEAILSPFNTTAEDNIRDRQMADNLLAYMEAHPGEKIICWGANVHFVNDMSSINAPVLREHVPMGAYLKKELHKKIYSLASVTAADSIYLNKVWSKTPVSASSFEQFLKDKGKPHLFISSHQHEMKKTRLTRLFSPIDFVAARLDLLHDGYLFFSSVAQATFSENEADGPILAVSSARSNPEQMDRQDNSGRKSSDGQNLLNEVLIISYNKKFTYSVVSKAIENIGKNYPVNAFNSKQRTNIDVTVLDETILNLDFLSGQYDRGYHQADRNSKQLKEVRWNRKEDHFPKSIREFWSLSYNNPIMYSRCLTGRKSKKFSFKISEVSSHDGRKVYVVDFSIPRNHFTYTHRSLPSFYSGTLYINQDDFAVVKVLENWTFTESLEKAGSDTYGWMDETAKKEIRTESIETNFEKKNGLYYLSGSEIEITGTLQKQDAIPTPFRILISSTWTDFSVESLQKIPYKDEQNLFGQIGYHKTFWESTDLRD